MLLFETPTLIVPQLPGEPLRDRIELRLADAVGPARDGVGRGVVGVLIGRGRRPGPMHRGPL